MRNSSVIFFKRKFPSANIILIKDQSPLLIDSGFGSDAGETEELIKEAGISPEQLHLVINTHYHSDHVGGNHLLQEKYGVRIAAHKWEASLINTGDSEACSSVWLDQPVEPYRVNIELTDNDEINTGTRTYQVIHTPGHTLGHISLYEPEEGVLISGDLFHAKDVGWLNIFREGVSAIYRSLESLDRIAELKLTRAYSGHGPQIENPLHAIDRARNRLDKWLQHPERVSWHACKRIFAFSLIMKNGIHKTKLDDYLLTCGWFHDYSRFAFQVEPKEFIRVLVDEMIRSGGAAWQDDYLMATAPYTVPQEWWINKKVMPTNW